MRFACGQDNRFTGVLKLPGGSCVAERPSACGQNIFPNRDNVNYLILADKKDGPEKVGLGGIKGLPSPCLLPEELHLSAPW